MSRAGQTKWRSAFLGLGLLTVSGSGVFAQQSAPPAQGIPAAQGTPAGGNLSEPVFRVSKNEASPTTPVSAPVAAPHPLDPALALARQSLALMQSE
ncbi:MAG: hypothetical protein FJ308_24430, partial [Planctomycetes bacterium]|nr:hypothetical protein [Planctomycetota bacterium]